MRWELDDLAWWKKKITRTAEENPIKMIFFPIKTTGLLENNDIHKTCATGDLMGGAHFCFERTSSEIRHIIQANIKWFMIKL